MGDICKLYVGSSTHSPDTPDTPPIHKKGKGASDMVVTIAQYFLSKFSFYVPNYFNMVWYLGYSVKKVGWSRLMFMGRI